MGYEMWVVVVDVWRRVWENGKGRKGEEKTRKRKKK